MKNYNYEEKRRKEIIAALPEVIIEVEKIWENRSDGVSLAWDCIAGERQYWIELQYQDYMRLIKRVEALPIKYSYELEEIVTKWQRAVNNYRKYAPQIVNGIAIYKYKIESIWQKKVVHLPYLLEDGGEFDRLIPPELPWSEEKDKLLSAVDSLEEAWSKRDVCRAIEMYQEIELKIDKFPSEYLRIVVENQLLAKYILEAVSLLRGHKKADFSGLFAKKYRDRDFSYININWVASVAQEAKLTR